MQYCDRIETNVDSPQFVNDIPPASGCYQGLTASPANAIDRESAGMASSGTSTSSTLGPTSAATELRRCTSNPYTPAALRPTIGATSSGSMPANVFRNASVVYG